MKVPKNIRGPLEPSRGKKLLFTVDLGSLRVFPHRPGTTCIDMIGRVFTALAFLATVTSMELTSDNYQAEVFGAGKNAFVKFLAPWYVARFFLL